MPGLRKCHTTRKPKEIFLLQGVCQKAAAGIREKQQATLMDVAFFVCLVQEEPEVEKHGISIRPKLLRDEGHRLGGGYSMA